MKTRMSHLLLILALAVSAFAEPQVRTNFGQVRGVWLTSARGIEVAGFLGLPYAEPPVGDLRFENPRPWREKWDGTRNAMIDAPMCMQMSEKQIVGDEDCLYLNIFTPTISKSGNATEEKKLPVMVFLHSNGFDTGSSNSSIFAPTYLLDYGIVLVTMNYRLNVLGFLSTGDAAAPGNYGLKDAAEALAWLRDNLPSFGGDPGSVTLLGHGDGAAVVAVLAASHRTRGLFHKAITMGGSPTMGSAFHSRDSIRNSSTTLAVRVGCIQSLSDTGSGDGEVEESTTTESEEVLQEIDKTIVECIKNTDALDVVIKGHYEHWWGETASDFGPTLEAEAEGAILTAQPPAEGLFGDIPWITGVTADEGLFRSTDILVSNSTDLRDTLVQRFEWLLPDLLEMGNEIDNITEFANAVKDFYFNGDILANLEVNITQVIGDGAITWPAFDFLEKQATKMKSNVYFYVLSYEGTLSSTFQSGIPYKFGVAHEDILNYLFPTLNAKYADMELMNTFEDETMINIICEMWTNFAKTGVPSALLTATWEPYQPHRRFMRFGEGSDTAASMQEGFLAERMAFWAEASARFLRPLAENRVDGRVDLVTEGPSSQPPNLAPVALATSLPLLCTCAAALRYLQAQ